MRRRLSALLVVAACAEAPGKLSLEEYQDRLEDTAGPKKDTTVTGDTGSDGSDGSDGVDATDATDATDGVDATDGDVVEVPDTGPVCVPTGPEICNGLDDDCNGTTDESGSAVRATVDFKTYTGWTRVNPRGSQAHSSGPVAFRGANDADSTVFSHLQAWTGDVELDVRLLLGSIMSDATWFIGSLPAAPSANPAEQPAALTQRTGIEIVSAGAQMVTVRAVVSDVVVAETNAQVGSFLGVLLRVNAGTGRVVLRLQKGDGSAVAETEKDGLTLAPTHGALVIAARGAVIGSVSKLEIDGTAACAGVPLPACDTCVATEPCTVATCNPLAGCDIAPVTCGFTTDCADAAVCDPTSGLCPLPASKNEGGPCNTDDRCKSGAVCAAGTCVGGSDTSCDPALATVCQDPGSCVAFVGCVYPNKPEGTECNDGSLCTSGDACESGQCVGNAAVTCPSNGPCEQPSTCDPVLGTCTSVLPLPDGSGCDDGNGCTVGDACAAGACTGAPNTCDDANPCTDDACQDGACVNTPSLACLQFTTAVSDGPFAGPPALSGASTILAGPKVWAVGMDGTVQWTSADVAGATTSPALSADTSLVAVGDLAAGAHRIVVLRTNDGGLVATGAIPGCTDDPAPCRPTAPPTWTSSGRLYVPTAGAGTLALETQDGSNYAVLWATPGVGTGARVVASDGGALIALQGAAGGTPQGLAAVDTAGVGRWLWSSPAPVSLTPAVGGGAIAVIAGAQVTSLTDDGTSATPRWSTTLSAAAVADPILLGNDRVVTATATHLIVVDGTACAAGTVPCATEFAAAAGPSVALAALTDGTIAWAGTGTVGFASLSGGTSWGLPLGALSATLPVWVGDRYVFGTSDGAVHAAPTATGLIDSEWPAYGRTQRRNTNY